MILNSAKLYTSIETSKLPANIGDISIVDLSELQSNKYISQIKDTKDNVNCTGWVTISKKAENEYTYLSNASLGYSPMQKGYVLNGISNYFKLDGLNDIASEITVEAVGSISDFNTSGWVKTLYSWGDEPSNKIVWLGYGFDEPYYQPYFEVGAGTDKIDFWEPDTPYIKTNETFYLSWTYKNGTLLGSNGPLSGNIVVDDANAYVGSYSGGDYLFNGVIKAIRIYNRALSDTEIQNNYQIDKHRIGI